MVIAFAAILSSGADGGQVGATQSGGDVLALGLKFPPCSVGDIVVMMDAGAYTLSRANRFTTLVPPAFLLDTSGNLQPLRRKETAEDVVKESESWRDAAVLGGAGPQAGGFP